MAALPAFEDTLLPSQAGDVLELDELWSFVEKKTQECSLWIALCRRTRQIVAYTVGDRSQQSAVTLRAQAVGAFGERLLVGQPEIVATGAAAVVRLIAVPVCTGLLRFLSRGKCGE